MARAFSHIYKYIYIGYYNIMCAFIVTMCRVNANRLAEDVK